MGNVIVRSARSADFAAIRELFDDLDRFHAAGEPGVLRIPNAPRPDRDELDEMIACADCFFAVAEQNGVVVGFVDASLRGPADPTDTDRPWCGVHNLAVRADLRRIGIGTMLMEATEQWVRGKGLSDVRLQVYAFNDAARAFYEHLGYRTLSYLVHKPLDAPDSERTETER